jgi:hypothetical protein
VVKGLRSATGAALLTAASCSPQLEVAPDALDFEDPTLGANNVASLLLKNQGRTRARGLELTVPAPFEAQLEAQELAAGDRLMLSVSLSPDAVGLFEGQLEIDARGLRMEPIAVPLRADVKAPELELINPQPVCGADGLEGQLYVGLKNVGAGPLLILDVTLSDDAEGAFWESEPLGPLTVAPQSGGWLELGCDERGESLGLLALQTNDPQQPLVELSLYPRALWLDVHRPEDGTVWSTEDPQNASFTAEYVGTTDGIYATWSSDLDGVFMAAGVSDGEPIEIEGIGLGPGTHTITLEATASDGAVATDQRILLVSTPPTIEITSPEPGTLVQEGESWTFEGKASDPDEAAEGLTARWTSDLDGELPGATVDAKGLVSTDPLILSPGTHTITLEVVDSLGIGASAQTDFTVNQPPTVTITRPTEGEVLQEQLVLEASISDLEGDASGVLCTWTSSLDGEVHVSPGDSATGTCGSEPIDATLGAHDITVQVTDSMGGKGEDTVSMLVDGAPTLTVSAPVDNAWRPLGGTLPLRGAASDVADLPTDLVVAYTSNLDGFLGVITPDSDGTFAVELALASVGDHRLTVTVEDTTGNTASELVDITIVDCEDNNDLDGDGFSPADGDCADGNPYIYPGSVGALDDPRTGCWGWDIATVSGGDDDYFLGWEIDAGDLDGDGLDDLIIGDPNHRIGSPTDYGAVVLLLGSEVAGSESIETTRLTSIVGAFRPMEFGHDLAFLPDIDGDGIGEFAAADTVATGSVHLFLGRASWTSADSSSADLTLTAGMNVDGLGHDLDGGDFDGDGIGDLVVGADGSDVTDTDAGAVFLFSGSTLSAGCTLSDDADLALYGLLAEDALGSGVSLVGDVDGDGVDDLLVSAPCDSSSAGNPGRVELYTGLGAAMASGVAPLPTASFHAADFNLDLGLDDMVGAAGDVDGDSYSDLLMAAVGYDSPTIYNVGMVYLWMGGPELTGEFEVASTPYGFVGTSNSGFQGDSIGPAGDLDGDGLGDFILGASRDDTYIGEAGRIGIFYGSSLSAWDSETPFDDADRLLYGGTRRDYAGSSVVGDLNLDGDGNPDLAVSATGYSGDGFSADGAVFVYLNVDQTCEE